MALAQCRECGKQVSAEANVCPHRGIPAPTTASSSPKRPGVNEGVSPFRKPPTTTFDRRSSPARPSTSTSFDGGAPMRERVLYRATLHWFAQMIAPTVFLVVGIMSALLIGGNFV